MSTRWARCPIGREKARLFRRLLLAGLAALQAAGRIAFLGDLAPLADKRAFDAEIQIETLLLGSITPRPSAGG